jgi:hypothetical protein
MRTHNTPKTIIVTLLLAIGVFNSIAQQDSCYRFTFHPRINHHPATFDSISVYNQTQAVGTKLYYPDTVYSNCATGISHYSTPAPFFQMKVKGANPFSTCSFIEISSAQSTKLRMLIVDMLGNICMEKNMTIAKGVFQYKVSISQGGAYILIAECGGQRFSQKLVVLDNSGNGTRVCNVELIDIQEEELKSVSLESSLPISDGDKVVCSIRYTIENQVVWNYKVISSFDHTVDYHLIIDKAQRIGCENFSLTNCEVQVFDDNAKNTHYYLTDYPPHIFYNITFYDSTFVSIPTEFAEESETFYYSGEYKYRIEQSSEYQYLLYICPMDQNINEATHYRIIALGDCDGFSIIDDFMDEFLEDFVFITRRF